METISDNKTGRVVGHIRKRMRFDQICLSFKLRATRPTGTQHERQIARVQQLETAYEEIKLFLKARDYSIRVAGHVPPSTLGPRIRAHKFKEGGKK